MKPTQLAAAVLLATGSVSAIAATYSITPVPLQDKAQISFARSIDNSGKMLASVQSEYNQPVDLEKLENDTIFFSSFGSSLESEDDVRQGVFSDVDYTTIIGFIRDNRNGITGQKLGIYRTYLTDTVNAELVPGLDQITDQFDDYTQSVQALGRDSINGDYIVGDSSALVITDVYEREDGEVFNYTYPTSAEQAFVQASGETKLLPPVDSTAGGLGSARAVNNNLQVAGFSTVSFQDDVTNALDTCADEETRGATSEGRCLFSVYNGTFTLPRISQSFINTSLVNSSSFFNQSSIPNFVLLSQVNATIWQLDVNGNVIDTQTYAPLVDIQEDDTAYYFSAAYDINDQGIAVGESLTGDLRRIVRPAVGSGVNESERVATVFRDGETTELLNRDDNLSSQAIAINDNNWITGSVLRSTSGVARERMFVMNLDTQELKFPEGFFKSAGVSVNAINNNNIVVGKAESEVTSETSRQTSAFMYDIESEAFVDLNDLVACDSEYTLVEAVDINDNNEIIANARIKSTSKYVTGVDFINSNGETVEIDTVVAVKLDPIANGEVEQCEIPEDERPFERSGAAMSWFSGALLAGLALFRRRRNVSK